MELMLGEWTHRLIVYMAIGFLLYRNAKLDQRIDKLRRDWKLDY